MKSMGDQYVKTEWRLHKRVDKKIASIFYRKWDEYLQFIITQRQNTIETMGASSFDNTDAAADHLESTQHIGDMPIGRDLDQAETKNLTSKQKEQLAKLKEEARSLFNQHINDNDNNKV
eukprot:gene8999-10555_t